MASVLPNIPQPQFSQGQRTQAVFFSIPLPLLNGPPVRQRQDLTPPDFASVIAAIPTATWQQSVAAAGMSSVTPDLTAYLWGQTQAFVPQTHTSAIALLGTPTLTQVNPETVPGNDRDWRRHLRRTRRIVHEHLGIRAVYALSPNHLGRVVRVRPRFKIGLNEAEGSAMHDTDAKVLFDRTEVSMPMVNGLIAFQSGEVYRIRGAEAPYMGYITVDVVPLPEPEAAAVWAVIVPAGFV